MVGKLHFASTVTTILILDLICNISQRDYEISPVSKIPHVFDVASNNFQCTDWRPGFHFVLALYSRDVTKKAMSYAKLELFYDS